MSGGFDAIRTELRREFDDLAELTAREALTSERCPAIADQAGVTSGGADEHGALQASVSSLVDRLPEGESRTAARYLWGMDDERDRLSVETRRSAAAQLRRTRPGRLFALPEAMTSCAIERSMRWSNALLQAAGARGQAVHQDQHYLRVEPGITPCCEWTAARWSSRRSAAAGRAASGSTATAGR
jgi:hypothetical protein